MSEYLYKIATSLRGKGYRVEEFLNSNGTIRYLMVYGILDLPIVLDDNQTWYTYNDD